MPIAVEPQTQAEYQAMTVIAAATDLAARIDAARARLGASPHRRRATKHELLEASERLVNLLVLVLRAADHDLAPNMAAHVRGQVELLRQRLLAASRHLIVDRARAASRRATDAMSGGAAYPLGLAGKLREVMSGVEATVEVLGGRDSLAFEEREVIVQADKAIGRLLAFEASLAVLPAVA